MPNRLVGSLLIAYALAGCSAPAPTAQAPEASGGKPVPAEAAEPQPLPVATGDGGEVAVETLPADIREYILKQRMCRHFSRPGQGDPALAAALCAGGDAATWRALIRKYEGDDTIGSILLAEKPLDAEP